ncbi:MAG: YbjN domain-containing protein [Pseudomonadota bacterium]
MSLIAGTVSSTELKKSYTDKELVDILHAAGYRAVEIDKDRVIRLKIDGLTYVLYVYEDDDLQLYFGLSGYRLTNAAINEWNRTKRLSRAYLDHENDPVIEADLLANAGFSESQFLEWLAVFDSVARSFRRFVEEKDLGSDETESDPSFDGIRARLILQQK